jgi:C4-dicarboxylate-specific signal transduction histidine kinase
MLGDQLIKNETIALTELVKNAYDADADVCRVKFINFNCDSTNNSESIIEISDNGYGMSKDIITKHFLNPATPIKKSGKELRKSKKGRICQGEKGIGRFSMLKLGKKVTVYSKEPECAVVHSIKFDFGDYDEEFLFRNGISEEIFLDQIEIQYDECVISSFDSTSLIAESQHGTVIRIEQLKGEWNQNKIDEFKKDMVRFSPFEIDDNSIVNNMDFNTDIYINGEQDNYKKSAIKKIEDIIYNKALYKVSGRYDEKNKRISFSYIEANDVKSTVVVYLSDNAPEDRNSIDFKGIRFYDAEVRKYFDGGSTTSCGDFSYEFYIFDFEAKPNEFFGLSKEDKEVVRDHRIFLYRDNVRVQPYGAPNDDWLQIDRTRAKDKAGNMFSNDQIVGQIKITKANNKNLKDKTSREGIIEDTIAFEQLSKLVKALLSFLRIKIYQRYKAREIAKKEVKSLAAEKQTRSDDIKSLREECKGNEFALRKLDAIEASIDKQERVYTQRIDVVEQLAGVGISVETASHDIMLSIDKLRDVVHQIHINSEDNLVWDREKIYNDSENAENLTSLIYMKMKDLQQIFVSSKQRPRPINVEDVIKKIESIYSKAYRERNIKVEYVKIGNSPVKAKTIDAVLFQVFINLFDNSLYWLQFINRERKVVIYLDGNLQRVIFADNGIGIAVEDAPYIFEAFYSGKGEEGRGLGLYIAKKLLNRYSYDMDVIINDYDKKECGANFSVEFTTDENLGV